MINFKKKNYISIFILPVLVISLWFCKAEKTLLEKDSVYNNIRVIDEGRFISLYCGNGHQSMMDKKIPERLVFNYTKTMMAAFAFTEKEPVDILLIGGGGGSIPKAIQKHFPAVKLDVVEIDPEINQIARNFFAFKPAKNTKLYDRDGRMFVKETNKKYDIVMLDAFRGGYIPFHLLTREFFTELKKVLKNDAIVVSNTFTGSRIRERENATYFSVFNNVYELMTAGNRILIADNNNKVIRNNLLKRARYLDKKHQFIGFDLESIIDKQFTSLAKVTNQEILTDDHAPAELLVDY